MAELNDTMNLPQIIDQLVDIDVPVPVTYTPETVGWWVLLVCLVAVASLTAYFWFRHRQTNRYRQIALAELHRLESAVCEQDAAVALAEVAGLVKRTALVVFPRARVAHLFGPAWQEFLQDSARIDSGPGLDALVGGAYRPSIDPAIGKLAITAARQWIMTHRV